MDISFKYVLEQKVTTPFGEVGLVNMLGYDENGVTYYVKTAGGGNWFKESQLSA